MKNGEFVSDEEALEFTDKNNIFFLHLSNSEKYETGLKNIIYFIINKYVANKILKYKIIIISSNTNI